jgi:voltage-gated potassium channel
MRSWSRASVLGLLDGSGASVGARVTAGFLATLISLNVLEQILESVASIAARNSVAFARFELVSVAVFATEYLLRLWACTSLRAHDRPIVGRLRYALTPMALVDLAAIAPAFMPSVTDDLMLLRALRLVRLVRSLKIARYSRSLRLLSTVLRGKKEELVMSAFVAFIVLLLWSTVIYLVERGAQPAVFSSIPAAMWWGVATMTTIGYGDMYPVTALGKVIGALVAITGIGVFALPTGIIASGFVTALQQHRGDATCPHCGEKVAPSRE